MTRKDAPRVSLAVRRANRPAFLPASLTFYLPDQMPIDPPDPKLSANSTVVAIPATNHRSDTVHTFMGLTARGKDVNVDIVYSLAKGHTVYFEIDGIPQKESTTQGFHVPTAGTRAEQTLKFMGGEGERKARVFFVTAIITPDDGSAPMRTSKAITIEGPIP